MQPGQPVDQRGGAAPPHPRAWPYEAFVDGKPAAAACQHAPAIGPPLVSTPPGEAWCLVSLLPSVARKPLAFLVPALLCGVQKPLPATVGVDALGDVSVRLAESYPQGGVLTSEGRWVGLSLS